MPRIAVGVMGSSEGTFTAETLEKLHTIGRVIAQRGCVLITGGGPGLPQAAVEGAHAEGGLVVGVSPGLSAWEHVHKYGCVTEGFDLIIYTGSGLMGREIENIRSSDIVIIAGGRSGTLGEFSIAYDEGRIIGVITGTGGITDILPELIRTINKDTGAHVLYDDDPERLMDRLLHLHVSGQGQRSVFDGYGNLVVPLREL